MRIIDWSSDVCSSDREANPNAAYNDAAGVTAAFNKNILARINGELGGDFGLAAFRHHAFWNADQGRVEMHLVCEAAQAVQVAGKAEARRVGKECVSTGRARRWRYHKKKKNKEK